VTPDAARVSEVERVRRSEALRSHAAELQSEIQTVGITAGASQVRRAQNLMDRASDAIAEGRLAVASLLLEEAMEQLELYVIEHGQSPPVMTAARSTRGVRSYVYREIRKH
jgi:hypothetical protein